MQLNLQNDYYQDAQRTVRLVDGLKNIYLVIMDLFGSIAITILAILLMIPINGLLEFLIHRMKKAAPIDLSDITPKEYRLLRIQHDNLGELLSPLNKIAAAIESRKSEIPFLLKWSMNIVMKARNILVERYERDVKAFEALSSSVENYKGFETVSEKELWENRPKTYEYLV